MTITSYHFLFQDTDECIINKPCPKGKFCVNNEGSYRCVNCDKVRMMLEITRMMLMMMFFSPVMVVTLMVLTTVSNVQRDTLSRTTSVLQTRLLQVNIKL